MRHERFDSLAQFLAGIATRRRVLSGAAGIAGLHLAETEADRRKRRKRARSQAANRREEIRCEEFPPPPAFGTTATCPECPPTGIELLSAFYPGYWWDHTELTVAVQAHPNADPAYVCAVREAIATCMAFALKAPGALLVPTAVSPYLWHPTPTAMALATLEEMAAGRVAVAVGSGNPLFLQESGRTVDRPVSAMREYTQALRRLWRGEAVHVDGEHVKLAGARMAFQPSAPIPIYIAAIGPKSVEQTAEIADGWLPIFYSPYRTHAYRDALEAGFRRAGGGKSLATFDVAPSVTVIQGDDVQACLDFVKPMLALYVGGMGARGKNFYNDLACRYGYEEAANKIQDLYLAGKKMEAMMAVPDELVDEVALRGPRERIAERLAAWKECGITTLICGASDIDTLRVMAELAL